MRRSRRRRCACTRETGIESFPATGPAGRITHEDLDAFAARDLRVVRSQALQPKSAVEDVKVIGLQRRIAEQMAVAHARIPPIAEPAKAQGAAEAHVAAVHDARDGVGDRESAAAEHAVRRRGGVIHQHAGIHIGVAAQTSAGLLVPVVRQVESLDCGTAPSRSRGLPKPRASAPRRARSCQVRPSRSRRSGPHRAGCADNPRDAVNRCSRHAVASLGRVVEQRSSGLIAG
jgi:2-oxoisovalerate dehydrogenase E2 component (dihydrolipoyl transacylase)